ncbi:MAG: molybdate ABC transporter substrate-binding protein [Sandaracinaceae bacterium]
MPPLNGPDGARKRTLRGALLCAFTCSLAAPSGGCSEEAPMRVFAAASLGPAMEDAAEAYEARTGTRVRVTAAGSQVLRRQLEAGAPADVYAPASYAHVEGAVRGSLGEVTLLACNRPVVVTGPGSAVRDLETLDRAERLVIGTPEAPIGAYTDAIFARAERRYGAAWRRRVDAKVVSRELDVRQVLTKVPLGEADAAIVYATDAARARSPIQARPIPEELGVVARYPIAVTEGAAPEARAFVRWLREDGFSHLARHGWTRCPSEESPAEERGGGA